VTSDHFFPTGQPKGKRIKSTLTGNNTMIDEVRDPFPILTGETVTFIADFYTMPANFHAPPTPYDFVVLQNGKEIDRLYALT
jgi:hypothetical protein